MKPVLDTVVPLETGGLEGVRGGEEHAEDDPSGEARPAERPDPGQRGDRQRGARDRKADGEEREERIDRDRVLDLDERDAPDRGDGEERERRHAARLRGRPEDVGVRRAARPAHPAVVS